MKVTKTRNNYNENGRWAEFAGSNTHSSGDISSRSSFGVQIVNCCMDHLSYAFFPYRNISARLSSPRF